MRVACAHHLAPVLENLHMRNPRHGSKLFELGRPRPHYSSDLVDTHARERQVMAWSKAHHAADSLFALGDQQPFSSYVEASQRRIFFQSGKVVLKDKRGIILRIQDSTRSLIARTQVAGGIISRALDRGRCFNQALPRPLRPVRRYQHPLLRDAADASLGAAHIATEGRGGTHLVNIARAFDARPRTAPRAPRCGMLPRPPGGGAYHTAAIAIHAAPSVWAMST